MLSSESAGKPTQELASGGGGDASSSSTAAPAEEAMPAFRSLVAIYMIAFVSSMDNAVVLPTLWPYVTRLCAAEGCGAHAVYGRAQAAFFLARTVAMFALGRALDARRLSFGGAMRLCLGTGAVGGVVYACAPLFSEAYGRGAAVVVGSRALCGAGSSVSVASFSFIAAHVPRARRTGLFARTIGCQRASTPLAPLFVLVLSALPGGAALGALPLSAENCAGFVVSLFNAVAALVLFLVYVEPPRPRIQGRAKAPSFAAVAKTLRTTGAWASFFFSFQNNWNNQALLWSLPIITSRLFGPNAVRDALIFATGGSVGVATAAFISSDRFRRLEIRDATMILASQSGVGAVLAVFSLVYGCPLLGLGRPLWGIWVLFACYYAPFIGQMPSNNAVYSKLIAAAAGPNQGTYQSLLEISKSLARAGAGLTIGAAYASAGPCALWGATLAIWAVQFLPFALVWRRYAAADEIRPRAPSLSRRLLADFEDSGPPEPPTLN